jgi:hypothetical protein
MLGSSVRFTSFSTFKCFCLRAYKCTVSTGYLRTNYILHIFLLGSLIMMSTKTHVTMNHSEIDSNSVRNFFIGFFSWTVFAQHSHSALKLYSSLLLYYRPENYCQLYPSTTITRDLYEPFKRIHIADNVGGTQPLRPLATGRPCTPPIYFLTFYHQYNNLMTVWGGSDTSAITRALR